MYASESLEIGRIEVQEHMILGMNLGHCYMILTFQIYISKNAAVKGVSWAVFCSDRGRGVSRCVIQGPLGWVRKSYEEGWIQL